MWNFLKTRGVDLAIAAIALIAFMSGPAWALIGNDVPGPGVGLFVGGAIVGALVIAKWWRGK